MEFKVSSSQLLKTVNILSGVISSNNTLPILDNFLFRIDKDKLTIVASDLETTMMSSIEIAGDEQGAIAVPAKMLAEILKTFPEQPLTFAVEQERGVINISYGAGENKGNCDIPFQSGDEYPQTPIMEGATEKMVASEILAQGINMTIFATGNDDMRPVMSGVLFKFTSEGLIFVATDAHKLVKYVRTDIVSSDPIEFIMPKKPLNLIRGIMAGIVSDVKIGVNGTNACFQWDDMLLVCRLIDGKYPNYEAVIPRENPNQLLADRAGLLTSLRRVALFANKTTHQIRLSLRQGEVQISAEDNDFNKKAIEQIACNYRGNAMDIGFNSRFLLEMLSNLESRDVTLDMSIPNRAGILKPVDKNQDEEITMLVMPVMLNN